VRSIPRGDAHRLLHLNRARAPRRIPTDRAASGPARVARAVVALGASPLGYTRSMRLLLPFLVGSLSLIGCGGDDAATGSPSAGSGGASADSGQSDADGSPQASDGGAGTSSESGTSDSSSASKSGFIGISSHPTDVPTVFTNSLGASFFDGPGYSYFKGCQHQVIGACQIQLCDFANGGDQMPPPGPVASAGTLTVGGTTPTFSLEYNAGTMLYGAVPAVPTDKLLFKGGDTITFAAAGGDVPAFSDSLVAPTQLMVNAPAIAGGALSIDASKDLVFAWSGSSVGAISFNIRTTTAGDASPLAFSFVSCWFAASALTGTIPAAQLKKLTKTDATTTALIGTDLSNTKEAIAGDYQVHLAVGGLATTADGKTPFASTQVTIF